MDLHGLDMKSHINSNHNIYIGFVWDATYQISNNVFGVASWKMSLRTVSAYHTLDGFVWKWVYPKIALWIGLMMINHFLFRQTQMWFPRGGGLWHEAEFALVSGMSCEQPVNRLDMDSNMSDHQKILNTSSTAQGGGRSFKDRKPIGEMNCCDAWMAELG
jgi:hypothetical protein